MNHIRTIPDVQGDYLELLGLQSTGRCVSVYHTVTLSFNGQSLVRHPYRYRDDVADIRDFFEAALSGPLLRRMEDDGTDYL